MFRPLHYVFRLGNRGDIQNFFINILGMKVLRHEEFREGCEATCNGPYAGKWSKTMVGYGEENTHFVIELTYNYGVASYRHSNDLRWIEVRSSRAVENARNSDYPYTMLCDNPPTISLASPDGYLFRIISDDALLDDPLSGVCLAAKDVSKTTDFYCQVLPGTVVVSSSKQQQQHSSTVQFNDFPTKIEFERVYEQINKTTASGRMAFSYTGEMSKLEEKVRRHGGSIKTPLITLETPGKASVVVVIVLDPNDHEICVVGDAGFRQLSEYDVAAETALNTAMGKDKSDDWFARRGGKKGSQ